MSRLAVYCNTIHSKKRTTCSGLMKAAVNNVVLPTLFNVVNNIVQHCWAWISPQSGVTMLNNIVDSIEQRGQHNIVQGCFHQPWTGCAFYACTSFRCELTRKDLQNINHWLSITCDVTSWVSIFMEYKTQRRSVIIKSNSIKSWIQILHDRTHWKTFPVLLPRQRCCPQVSNTIFL